MKEPKEIYITKQDASFLSLPLGFKGLNGLITISDAGNQLKYISESHVNELMEEKDKAIASLQKEIEELKKDSITLLADFHIYLVSRGIFIETNPFDATRYAKDFLRVNQL